MKSIKLLVTGRGDARTVARYLYGNSRLLSAVETDGRVTAVVELDPFVQPLVQIDRYASGLFGARVI